VKANLRRCRIDEVTNSAAHNAMVLATHGRALWVLDHLEPIQEYAASRAAAEPKLFTPPPYRRVPPAGRAIATTSSGAIKSSTAENPPRPPVISWINPRQVGDVRLKIADAAGRDCPRDFGQRARESNGAAFRRCAGICRVQPAPPAAGGGPRGRASRTRRGW